MSKTENEIFNEAIEAVKARLARFYVNSDGMIIDADFLDAAINAVSNLSRQPGASGGGVPDVELKPGWLKRDIEAASARVAEWEGKSPAPTEQK